MTARAVDPDGGRSAVAGLVRMLQACPESPLLRALGLPDADASQPALVALHAGAACHKLAVIGEVADAYCRAARLAPEELAYRALLTEPLAGEAPRAAAARFYRAAAEIDPRLAEAWFALARLDQHRGDAEAALEGFVRALELKPHPRAPAHAALHANAHFHRACLLEDLGRDNEALGAYRAAAALLDGFGVHHARIARFLRRRGLIAESIPHFEKLLGYSHRYFTEFTLPPLADTPPAAPPTALEVLYEASDGALIVFHNGGYVRLPAGFAPLTPGRLDAFERQKASRAAPLGRLRVLLRRLLDRAPPPPRELRRADNMAALEPGPRSPR